MSSCRKCKDSIRPAASAVTIKGEEFHPTCVSCSRCERCIWGKEFNRSTDGSLQCVRACTPINRPSSPPRLSTAVVLQQQQQQSQQYRQMGKPIQFTETGINKKGRNGASRYDI